MTLKHGQSFKPNEAPAKECTCFDGLIKCAPITKITSNTNEQQQQQKLTIKSNKLTVVNEPKRASNGNNQQQQHQQLDSNGPNSRLNEITLQRH